MKLLMFVGFHFLNMKVEFKKDYIEVVLISVGVLILLTSSIDN